MKYLGVLLDEHMSWNEPFYQIKLKLNCTYYAFSVNFIVMANVNIYFKNCILFTLSISSAIWYTTMGPEKSRNQRNNAETPKSCSQKN